MPELDRDALINGFVKWVRGQSESAGKAYAQAMQPREKGTIEKLLPFLALGAGGVAALSGNRGVDRAMGMLAGGAMGYSPAADASYQEGQNRKLGLTLDQLGTQGQYQGDILKALLGEDELKYGRSRDVEADRRYREEQEKADRNDMFNAWMKMQIAAQPDQLKEFAPPAPPSTFEGWAVRNLPKEDILGLLNQEINQPKGGGSTPEDKVRFEASKSIMDQYLKGRTIPGPSGQSWDVQPAPMTPEAADSAVALGMRAFGGDRSRTNQTIQELKTKGVTPDMISPDDWARWQAAGVDTAAVKQAMGWQ